MIMQRITDVLMVLGMCLVAVSVVLHVALGADLGQWVVSLAAAILLVRSEQLRRVQRRWRRKIDELEQQQRELAALHYLVASLGAPRNGHTSSGEKPTTSGLDQPPDTPRTDQ